jgi:hypothetical protein
MLKQVLSIILILNIAVCLYGQQKSESSGSLSNSYRSLTLGSSMAVTRDGLKNDNYFDYVDPDVTMVNPPDLTRMNVSGRGYINSVTLQFYKDSMYSIILDLNTEMIDYYSIYNDLTSKYGNPQKFSSKIVRWQSGDVQLSLEKPLIVKYVQVSILESIKTEKQQPKSVTNISKEKFLEDF